MRKTSEIMRKLKAVLDKLTKTPNDAELCRLNGWDVGTVLVGDEGRGPEKIKITAIGEALVLARRIENTSREVVAESEGVWTLACREWEVRDE